MTHPLPLDITTMPDLAKIAEEVEATRIPRELKRKEKTVAVIVPVKEVSKGRKQKSSTQADYAAFKAAAGSWKDVDVEKFKADIYASRRLSTRPPVKL